MKYLQKSFKFSFNMPRSVLEKALDEADRASGYREWQAEQPHEFMNGGVMCQICSLGREAKIHETKHKP